MRMRYLAAPAAIVISCLNAPVQAQDQATEAVVTAARGNDLTLGVGANDGARTGAIYILKSPDGKTRATIRITEVRATESSATIVRADEDVVVTVGDTLNFDRVETAPATPAVAQPTPTPVPTATPLAPATPGQAATATAPVTAPVMAPTTVIQPEKATSSNATETTIVTTTASPSQARIASVDGEQVTLSAGHAQGARTGATVPVIRNGNVVALVRVQVATENTSTGTVIWRDENAQPPAIGDAVGIYAGAGSIDTTPALPPSSNAPEVVSAAPIRYENGASNATVPRADFAYEYLAGLASHKLITRYPAHVFHDDGTRYHRADEDILFTRAQIADLIREALTNAEAIGDDKLSSGDRVALSGLVDEFRRELQSLGVAQERLAGLAPQKGLEFGFSGQSRATLVGGTTRGVIEPFSESQGGRRTRNGFDSRTNVYARSGDNLRFYGTVDTGTDVSRNSNDSNFRVRRALFSYNAERQLRGLTLEAGRDELWFGPGRFGTLLLGDAAGPLNLIRTQFKRGSYELTGFYAPLDQGFLGGQRSLYGHNFQVQLGKQTRIGLAETLLLPRDRFDALSALAAFSPIPLFTVERLRKRNTSLDNGNSLVEAYFESTVAKGFSGYGELLIDDIGVNDNNLLRNRIGLLAGVRFFHPRDPAKLGASIEYANLQGRTYLGLRALNDGDYYYRNRPLGYPVAPQPGAGNGGAESLRLDGYWRIRPRLWLGAGVEFADLNSEQPVFARQQIYRFRATYDLTRRISLTARAQRVSTSRPNFILGEPSVRQRLFSLEVARSF